MTFEELSDRVSATARSAAHGPDKRLRLTAMGMLQRVILLEVRESDFRNKNEAREELLFLATNEFADERRRLINEGKA
ncbi:hypothetical protein ACN20G_23345 [Streptomyces sp. BI20]|uniref:hypothetical protein n=1 Tax=Streptomyces sp. BI20 TaxID=3403460 RepID=UPI003C70BB1A